VRVALVSGDGIPVSGLLTVFRNVIELGHELGVVELPVHADLGYSWRPDKPGFFPRGSDRLIYPDWLTVSDAVPPHSLSDAELGDALTAIRADVAAFDTLDRSAQERAMHQIEPLADAYRRHFRRWLADCAPDWVFAVNLTLSDAVPVSYGLQDAVRDHFRNRPGGIVYWDHDLFGSCAIHDPETGARCYPVKPNALTPLPQRDDHTRWIVVSAALAAETTQYPTDASPVAVSNILPTFPEAPLESRHIEFARQHDLDIRRPTLLNPVRVFAIKGVEIAVELLAAARDASRGRNLAPPYLLVFGSLDEDPDYARTVRARVHELGVDADIRFLDGVPLSSCRDHNLRWHLDETDLLRLANATHGGIVFTPSVADVETVGLAPGLGALAGLPCAVTDYDAFHRIYGSRFTRVRVPHDGNALRPAADALVDVLARTRRKEPATMAELARNRAITERRFPTHPWRNLWRDLEELIHDDRYR
jgi:hypothetical protein